MALVSARHLATPVLSWDEIATEDVATRTVAQIWQLSRRIDAAVTPYYLLMHLWTRVFGISEWALRAPSWIAMAVTAGLLGELGRRLLSAPAGLLGGVLFAMVPQTSRYAQEARVYAIAGMLLVLATLVLYRLLERPRAGTAVRYGILVALLGTSHILALTGVAGHAVIAGLRWYRERQRRPMLLWLAATAGAAVLLAPLMLAASGQVDSQLGWIYGPLTTGDVLAAPRDIVGSAGAAWLLVGLALLATWRPHRVAELAALTLAPVVILGTAAALGQPFWVPRYLLIAIPPLVLLAAAAVAGRSPTAREGVARAVIVIVALGWAALPDQRALRETDSHNGGNYRRAAATVARGQQPGDVLLFQSHNRDMRPGIYYYLRADPGRPADFLLGRSAADVGDLWPVEVTDPVPRLRAQRRVWFFVYGRPPDPTAQRPDLAPVLRTEFRVVTIRRMSSSTLVLYERIRP